MNNGIGAVLAKSGVKFLNDQSKLDKKEDFDES